MSITEITKNSWPGILQVQAEAYTHIPQEEVDVLKSKWKASPKTCFVYHDSENKVIGYLLAHPWNSDEPPKLFEKLPHKLAGDILYLHDLAISSNSRGLGVGKKLSNKLIEIARLKNFRCVLLVAVQGAEDYWFNFGFREVHNMSVSQSYGVNAKLMSLDTQV